MDDAFIIAEVLTSSDYFAAAEAVYSWSEDKQMERDWYAHSPEEVDDIERQIKYLQELNERLKRVAKQVREQEFSAVGV